MDRDMGEGTDSRNAGAYGDTQLGERDKDRQTGLVKKSGER